MGFKMTQNNLKNRNLQKMTPRTESEWDQRRIYNRAKSEWGKHGGDGKSYSHSKALAHRATCFKECGDLNYKLVGFHPLDCGCAQAINPIYGFLSQIPDESCSAPCGASHPFSLARYARDDITFENTALKCGAQTAVSVYAYGKWDPGSGGNVTSADFKRLHQLCSYPTTPTDRKGKPGKPEVNKNGKPELKGNDNRRCAGSLGCPTVRGPRKETPCCQIRLDNEEARQVCKRVLTGDGFTPHCWVRVCHKKLEVTTGTQTTELVTTDGKKYKQWTGMQTLEKASICEYTGKSFPRNICHSTKQCLPTTLVVTGSNLPVSLGPNETVGIGIDKLDSQSAELFLRKMAGLCSIEQSE